MNPEFNVKITRQNSVIEPSLKKSSSNNPPVTIENLNDPKHVSLRVNLKFGIGLGKITFAIT